MTEADIENYFAQQVKHLDGEVRKVQWIGRRNAPDRRAMLPVGSCLLANDGFAFWVEFKHPDTGHLFPMNAHERAQHREHERMRRRGETVLVLWTREQVDQVLA